MGLETVAEDIREDAREEAEAIVSEADAEAEEIVDEAEDRADEVLTARESEVERQIEREREQAVSSATLEAKQSRLEARRDRLQAVRDTVEEELSELSGERREDLTRSLLEAGAEEFAGDASVVVHGRSADADLLEDVLEDYDGYSVGEPVECLGGVVLESEGSRIRVNNTFDSVLESVWEDDLQSISSRLFDDAQ
jgi:V/A-type H+-transporting ATPase subunit E